MTHHAGKKIWHGGRSIADARSEDDAAVIVAHLKVADWIDAQADKQASGGVRLAFRVLAQNIRTGLMVEDL